MSSSQCLSWDLFKHWKGWRIRRTWNYTFVEVCVCVLQVMFGLISFACNPISLCQTQCLLRQHTWHVMCFSHDRSIPRSILWYISCGWTSFLISIQLSHQVDLWQEQPICGIGTVGNVRFLWSICCLSSLTFPASLRSLSACPYTCTGGQDHSGSSLWRRGW